MKQEIKNRIKDINNGIVPSGYEKTEFGIFPCDWVTDKRLKDIGTFGKGKGLPGDKMTLEGVPCVGYGDIYMKYNNFHFEKAKSFVDEETASESQPIQKGTLLFTGTGETAEEIGKCVCYNGDETIYAGGDIITFISNKVNPLFLAYQQYQDFSLRNKASFGQGHSVVHIQCENLEKLHVVYPKSTDEQSKIAEILMKWDEAIELYNQQVEKLKQLKSIWLKKMFPKKGERVPEWRFKGFTDAWEQRKLGELFSFRYGDGNTNPSNGGQYPVFGAGGIQGGYTEFNAENSIIIGHMGDAGCVSWGDGKHFVTYNGTITKPKNDIFSSKFGYYLLLSMDLRKYRGGSGLPFLTYEMLTEMWTQIPKEKDETRLIAECFSYLDDLITLHQCKVEKIKAQQKVLQKYLLNGIVRV